MKLEDLPDEICAWCGKGYETNRTYQKYCCAECRRQSRSAFYSAVWHEEHKRDCEGRTCKQCGKTFNARSRLKIYCSQRCAGNAWIDRTLIPERRKRMAARAGRICPECGKTFDAVFDTHVCCSKRCAQRHRRGSKRTLACIECGTPIPLHRRVDAKTCSLLCQRRNRNNRNREHNRALARKRYAARRAESVPSLALFCEAVE